MFVQFWVDQLVDKYLGCGDRANWMADHIPLEAVPAEARESAQRAADRASIMASVATGEHLSCLWPPARARELQELGLV